MRGGRGVVIVAAMAMGAGMALGVPPGEGSMAAQAVVPTANSTWRPAVLPPGLKNVILNSVSCAGRLCVASGQKCSPGGCGGLIASKLLVSRDYGRRWRKEPVPADVGNLFSVSCPTVDECFAGGLRGPVGPSASWVVLRTTDRGTSWQARTITGLTVFDGLSCVSGSTCIAIGGTAVINTFHASVAFTTDGGLRWTPAHLPPGLTSVFSLSCATATSCVALGSTGTGEVSLRTTNGGRTWHEGEAPLPMGASYLSCPAATECMDVIDAPSASGFYHVVATTTTQGRTWTVKGGGGPGSWIAVDCYTSTACVVVGSLAKTQGRRGLASTDDFGSTWHQQRIEAPMVPLATSNLSSVSCSAAGQCLAAGSYYLKNSAGKYIADGPVILHND